MELSCKVCATIYVTEIRLSCSMRADYGLHGNLERGCGTPEAGQVGLRRAANQPCPWSDLHCNTPPRQDSHKKRARWEASPYYVDTILIPY